MTRVIANTVEYGRLFRALLQPISDDCGVTWCEATVGIADDENVDIRVIGDRKAPEHRRQMTLAADVAYLGTQLTQTTQYAAKRK